MANLIRRQSKPFFLTDLQDEINRLFDFSGFQGKGVSEIGDFAPPIDIKDEKDHYLITVDVPGVDPKNIEITMHEGLLTIHGEKEIENKEEREGYVRMERAKGSFYRQFGLPESVDSKHISAKSKHGVLQIVVPKSKQTTARKIDIQTES
jgi:HSP20 family protein